MKYDQVIEVITSYGDVAVDGPYFWIRSTKDWVEKNQATISALKARAEDLNNNQTAKRIYKTALEIVEALGDERNIYEAGTLPERKASIYPLV